MDITNIPQNLIKALDQKNTEQLVALARLLNLTLGKMTHATVTEVSQVTPQERQELLKQTANALVQLNQQIKNPAQIPPAIKTEITRLLDQQQLIKSPELKWVNLLVNNRPLLTFTDKPLNTGQVVPVQLTQANKLVLMDLPAQTDKVSSENSVNISATEKTEKLIAAQTGKILSQTLTADKPLNNTTNTSTTKPVSSGSTPSPTTQAASTTEKYAASIKIPTTNTTTEELSPAIITGKKIASPEILKNLADNKLQTVATLQTNQTNITAKTEHVQQQKLVIAEQLRQLLPHQDAPSQLYSALTQWQQISKPQQQHITPPTIQQALKSLAEQLRSPLQLTQPKILAQAIKNSGIFFENKLSQHIQQNPLLTTANNAINAQQLSRIYSQDLKGSLLNLLSNINKEIAIMNPGKDTRPATTIGDLLSIADNDADQNIENLSELLKQIANKPVKELSNKELRTQLLTLLQQHSLHSIAKIQLQQLHSLNHDIDNKENTQQGTSWQLEIPVKHPGHGEVQHFHVRIDREWVDDKNSPAEKNQTAQKVKQWSVTLRFDLPTLGEFCAQMAIVDTSVSATLWAAQEKTLERVRKKMDWLREQLEHEGINVKQIQCMQGMPPQKPMKLSYSLIDVST